MAKLRKYKLSWTAPESKNIIGYRVYWSQEATVGYDSEHVDMFNITELTIFDEFLVPGKPVMFGVTAVDFDGNESDIVTLPEPFQVHVPEPPSRISIGYSERFKVLDIGRTGQNEEDDHLAEAIKTSGGEALPQSDDGLAGTNERQTPS